MHCIRITGQRLAVLVFYSLFFSIILHIVIQVSGEPTSIHVKHYAHIHILYEGV